MAGRLNKPISAVNDIGALALKVERLQAMPAAALFTTDDAALYLNTTMGVLRSWRHQRRGPEFQGRGQFIRYRKGDLDAFLAGYAETPHAA